MSVISTIATVVADTVEVFPLVQKAITGVEALFGSGNGPAKLNAATSATLSALQIYAETTGKTLPAGFQADLQAAINAMVQVMNDFGQLLPHMASAAPAN